MRMFPDALPELAAMAGEAACDDKIVSAKKLSSRPPVSPDAVALENRWIDFSQRLDVFKRVVFRLNAKWFLDNILGCLASWR